MDDLQLQIAFHRRYRLKGRKKLSESHSQSPQPPKQAKETAQIAAIVAAKHRRADRERKETVCGAVQIYFVSARTAARKRSRRSTRHGRGSAAKRCRYRFGERQRMCLAYTPSLSPAPAQSSASNWKSESRKCAAKAAPPLSFHLSAYGAASLSALRALVASEPALSIGDVQSPVRARMVRGAVVGGARGSM